MKALRIFVAILALSCASTAYAQKKQNGFSVVLLLGQTWGPSSLEGLPPAPGLQKALDDVKDFLPYKGYKLLDTQWMRSGMSRMKGADDQDYEVTVEASDLLMRRNGGVTPFDPAAGQPGLFIISFHLQEAGASAEWYARTADAEREKQMDRAKAALAEAKEQLVVNQQKYGPKHPAVLAAEMAVKRAEGELSKVQGQVRARPRNLLESRFEMAPGETVVVGTSKIGGDKGLVVLLTAIK